MTGNIFYRIIYVPQCSKTPRTHWRRNVRKMNMSGIAMVRRQPKLNRAMFSSLPSLEVTGILVICWKSRAKENRVRDFELFLSVCKWFDSMRPPCAQRRAYPPCDQRRANGTNSIESNRVFAWICLYVRSHRTALISASTEAKNLVIPSSSIS